jgi:hypothetical protein
MIAFQLVRNSMGGSGPLGIVYTEKRSAEIWAEVHAEDWVQYKVKEVEVREFNSNEGAVGDQLVQIHRDRAVDLIKARALTKLTAEERAALGLPA